MMVYLNLYQQVQLLPKLHLESRVLLKSSEYRLKYQFPYFSSFDKLLHRLLFPLKYLDTVLYQGYGADIRQAADASSIRMLRANGHSPQVMADFLKALEAARFANPAWMVAAQRVPISLFAQLVDARRLQAFRDKSE